MPVLVWWAIAGGGALLAAAGGWWGRGQAADLEGAADAASGPPAQINIQDPPTPPAPQTLEDLRGGWTPEKLWDAYGESWNQYRVQASENVVLRPPSSEGGPLGGNSLLMWLALGAVGVLALSKR